MSAVPPAAAVAARAAWRAQPASAAARQAQAARPAGVRRRRAACRAGRNRAVARRRFRLVFGRRLLGGVCCSASSCGVTISTGICSAVTAPNGCTSENRTSNVSSDTCAIADAVMSDGMIRRSSIASKRCSIFPYPASIASARSNSSIPFRRKTEIREPAGGMAQSPFARPAAIDQANIPRLLSL